MQYILTEDEFAALKRQARPELKFTTENLQIFCTYVAERLPVHRAWSEDKTPWGCIITSLGTEYCDECPAKAICPHPYKKWSK